MSEFKWDENLVLEFVKKQGLPPSFTTWESLIKDFESYKQPKPEWKIISFWCNAALFEWDEKKDGYYVKHEHPWTRTTGYSEEHCTIHSVKRLSDGEVFTVGDVIKTASGQIAPLKGFEVWHSNMLAKINECESWGLSHIQKHTEELAPVLLTPSEIEKLKNLLNG